MLVQRNEEKSEDLKKLLPLRQFAKEGPYSAAYLSILVQRKSLKARRVGRNFFTTREWFNEYLERHAQEKKSVEAKTMADERSLETARNGQSGITGPKIIFNIQSPAMAVIMAVIFFMVFRYSPEVFADFERMGKSVARSFRGAALGLNLDGVKEYGQRLESEKKAIARGLKEITKDKIIPGKELAKAGIETVGKKINSFMEGATLLAGNFDFSFDASGISRLAFSGFREVEEAVNRAGELTKSSAGFSKQKTTDMAGLVFRSGENLSNTASLAVSEFGADGKLAAGKAADVSGQAAGKAKEIAGAVGVNSRNAVGILSKGISGASEKTVGMTEDAGLKGRDIALSVFNSLTGAGKKSADLTGSAAGGALSRVNALAAITASRTKSVLTALSRATGELAAGLKGGQEKTASVIARSFSRAARNISGAMNNASSALKSGINKIARSVDSKKALLNPAPLADEMSFTLSQSLKQTKNSAGDNLTKTGKEAAEALGAAKNNLGATSEKTAGEIAGALSGAKDGFNSSAGKAIESIARAGDALNPKKIADGNKTALGNIRIGLDRILLKSGIAAGNLAIGAMDGLARVSVSAEKAFSGLGENLENTNRSIIRYKDLSGKYLARESGRSFWSAEDIYARTLDLIIPDKVKKKFALEYAQVYNYPENTLYKNFEHCFAEATQCKPAFVDGDTERSRQDVAGEKIAAVPSQSKTYGPAISVTRVITGNTVKGDLNVSGGLWANKVNAKPGPGKIAVSVKGNAEFDGNLVVGKTARFNGGLVSAEGADFRKGIYNDFGNLTVEDDMDVHGALSVNSLRVEGAAEFSGDLNLNDVYANNITAREKLTVLKDAYIQGNEIVGGNLDVYGTFSAGHSFFSSLGVGGLMSAYGLSSGKGGISTDGPANINGSATFGSSLVVSGAVAINNVLTISESSTSALTVSDGTDDTFSVNTTDDIITITAGVNTTGDSAFTGNLAVTGDTTLTGTTTIAGDVGITGNTSITGDLIVTGNTSWTGTTTLTGDIYLAGALRGSSASTTAFTYGDGTRNNISLDTINSLLTLGYASTTDEIVINSRQMTINSASATPAIVLNYDGTGRLAEFKDNGTDRFVINDGGTVAITAASSTASALTITQNDAGNILDLYDGLSNVFTILDGGNVGIGTTTPSRRFSVVGDSFFDGGFYHSGNATTTGSYYVGGNFNLDGNITGGTYNKITITAPSGGATLTIADGKIFTVNNSLVLAGEDNKTVNFGANSLTFTTIGDTTLTLPLTGTLIANPMTALGDILYGGASGLPSRLAAAAGFLKSDGLGAPAWTTISLSDVAVPTVGSPSVITNLNGAYDYIWSAGVVFGGGITDNGDGTVDISAGEAMLRTSASDTAPLKSVDFPAANNLALTDNTTNYIFVSYNSGNPAVETSTVSSDYNCLNKCHLYTVVREGTELSILDGRNQNIDANRKLRRKNYETEPFSHVSGGSLLGNSNRYLLVSAGGFYYSLLRIDHGAFDTSAAGATVDRVFDSHYRNGAGGWTHIEGEKQVDNTSYDDGDGGLAALTDGNYGVHWMYIVLGTIPKLSTVYGRGDYASVTAAQAEGAPQDLPPSITGAGVLIGRVIIQKNNAAINTVESAFSNNFNPAGLAYHSNLAGLIADDHLQYALLAGRSGGQTLIGGANAADGLILQTTSVTGITGADMIFKVGDNGATEAMRILNSGNVGIGTTSPGYRLEVSAPSGVASRFSTTAANNALEWVGDTGGIVGALSSSATNLYIGRKNGDGGYADFSIDTNGKVAINSADHNATFDVNGTAYISGNVGIGTSTPILALLDVNGNAAIENQGELRFYELRTGGMNYAGLKATSTMTSDIVWTLPGADGTTGQSLLTNGLGNLYWGDSSAVATLDDLTDVDVIGVAYGGLIYYNGASWEDIATSSLNILTNGAAGLDYDTGTGLLTLTDGYNIPLTASTTNWNAFYDVPSNRITDGNHLTWTGNQLDVDDDWYNAISDIFLAKGYMIVGDDNGLAQATSSLFMSSIGNVGIGTTSPASKLSVFSSDGNQLTLGYDATHYVDFLVSAAGNLSITPNVAGAVTTIGSGADVALKIDENGNVGIGTTEPLALLDVNGDVILSGASRYLNFGSAVGTSGYGIRDNSGTLEYKNSGGSWLAIGSGSGSSDYDLYTNSGLVAPGGYLDVNHGQNTTDVVADAWVSNGTVWQNVSTLSATGDSNTDDSLDMDIADEANYDIENLAYSTTLTPSATTGDVTLTLGSGNWNTNAKVKKGMRITGNGGEAIINADPAAQTTITATVVTAFSNTDAIASGSWEMTGQAMKDYNSLEQLVLNDFKDSQDQGRMKTGASVAGDSPMYATQIDTNKILVAYSDYDNSYYGKAVVATVSGSTVTYSTPVTFYSGNTSYISIASLGTDKAIIAYRNNSTGYGNAIVATISGTTITYGAVALFSTVMSTAYISVAQLGTDKAIIAYDNSSNYGNAIVASVSGTTITYGSAVQFSVVATYISAAQIGTDKALITYAGASSYGNAIVATVSGTTISYGSAVAFKSVATSFVSVAPLGSDKAIIAYQAGGAGYARVASISGTVVSYGTEATFNSASSQSVSSAPLGADKAIITYRDDGDSSYGHAITASVSGTTISYGAESTYFSNYTYYTAVAKSDTDKALVIGAYNAGVSTGRVASVSGTTISLGADEPFGYYYDTDYFYFSAAQIDTDKVLVAYQGAFGAGFVKVGTVSGSTVTYGAPVSFYTAAAEYISLVKLDTNKALIAFKASSSTGSAVVASVSGTTVSLGATVAFNSTYTIYVSAAPLGTNKAIIAFADNVDSYFGHAIVASVSGTTITYGAETIFNSGANTLYISATQLTTDKALIAFSPSASYYGYAIVASVSGTTITYGSAVNFNAAATYYNSVVKVDTDKAIIAYSDTGDSAYGHAITASVSGTTVTFGGETTFSDAAITQAPALTSPGSNQASVVYWQTGGNIYVKNLAVNGTTLSADDEGLDLGSMYDGYGGSYPAAAYANDHSLYYISLDSSNYGANVHLIENQFSPIDSLYITATTDTNQLDSSYWTNINSIAATETTNGETIDYAVSYDDRATWKIYDNTDGDAGWRPIARNNSGTWQYNANTATGLTSVTWTAATTNTQAGALDQAMQVTANQMTGTEMNALTDAQQESSGGYAVGSTETLDFAV
ncbi:MAG: hypothetical protein WCW25_03995, partial [Patescibacteria group bacterium]